MQALGIGLGGRFTPCKLCGIQELLLALLLLKLAKSDSKFLGFSPEGGPIRWNVLLGHLALAEDAFANSQRTLLTVSCVRSGAICSFLVAIIVVVANKKRFSILRCASYTRSDRMIPSVPDVSSFSLRKSNAVLEPRESFFGGAKRDRTADLLVANEALSQLSYSPTVGGNNFRILTGSGSSCPVFQILEECFEICGRDLRLG
jgi:hypothetical protein